MPCTHNSFFTKLITVSFGLCLTGVLQSTAAPAPLKPKTSQHASFKPANFERLAVIVKPIKQERSYGYGYRGPGGSQDGEQGQMERQIEQSFMRVLIGGGYTLVSRGDLDAAMKEKGLDQANMTDDKRTQEAGKLLHVSSLLIVTVDSFKTTPVQLQAAPVSTTYQGGGGGYSRNRSRTYTPAPSYSRGSGQTVYKVTASVSARLVKIDDNMVVWTGDFTLNQTLASQDQDSQLLAAAAESIAIAFPPLIPPATNSIATISAKTNAPAASPQKSTTP